MKRQSSTSERFLLLSLFVVGTFVAVTAKPSEAKDSGRWSVLGAGEYWGDENIPGHVIALLAWSKKYENKGTLTLEYNTDTLRIELDGYRLRSGLDFGGRVSGQLGIANLLTDYFADGVGDRERGFYASYVGAQTWLKMNPINGIYIQLEMGGRKWFFNPTKDTANGLQLPDENWVFEPRVFLTWWSLNGDKAWGDRHRFFPRLRGIATGVYGGINLLDSPRSWGTTAGIDELDAEKRNQPDSLQFFIVHWLKAGRQILPWLRWQLSEESGWSAGEDDVYRRTVGGLNPYVPTIPGVPWAYFHSGDYASFETSIPIRIAGDVELGPLVGLVYLRDIDRRGDDDFSMVWGAGLHLDARFGQWQVDVRSGYSPTLSERYSAATGWSGFVSVGYGI